MTDAEPKGVSLDAAKERLFKMRDKEFARMMRRDQLPRIAAIDAAIVALDEAPTEWEPASPCRGQRRWPDRPVDALCRDRRRRSPGARFDPRDHARRKADRGGAAEAQRGVTAIQPVATLPKPSSPAALRMRRLRERHRQGDVIVSLDVESGAIAALVALGWLPEPGQGNKGAVTRALIDLYDRAIQARVTPSTGSHDQLGFMCTIQRSTIETLVALGWLHADQRDDFAAIVKAFRRFAGRALAVARNGGRDRRYLP